MTTVIISILRRIIWLILTSGESDHDIAARLGVSHNTVRRYRELVTRDGLTEAELQGLTDEEIDRRYNKAYGRLTKKRQPDYARIHAELQRPGVTRALLRREYEDEDPATALSRSQFNQGLADYQGRLPVSMRIVRPAGEAIYVDYAGKAPLVLAVTDPETGEKRSVQLFVAVVGASNRIFAYATPDQRLESWIDAHNQMARHFGRLTRTIVCDNLKSGVLKALRGEDGALINPTYLRWAEHHQVIILPARPHRPKDKAPVEGGVLI